MAIIFNIQEAVRNKTGFNVLQEPFKMLFTKEVEAYEKSSIINKIFTTLKLDSFQEEFKSKTTMDGFEPGADMEPAKLSDFEEGYGKVFRSVTWRNSFVVSKQAIEDNQMNQITADGVGFIDSYGRTKEQFAAKAISGMLAGKFTYGKYSFDMTGMDTTDGDIDGTKQKYFHNAHKSPVDGIDDKFGTQSNKFKCHVDLSDDTTCERLASIVGQVDTRMKTFKDYKGNIVPFNPTLILMAENYKFKNALVRALAESQNVSVNHVSDYEIRVGKWTIIVSPYLTGLDGFKEKDQAFIMIDPVANARNKGIVWVDRKPLELTSYYEDKDEANVWKGRSRFSAGCGDFRCAAYVYCGDYTTAASDNDSTNYSPNGYANATELETDDVALGKSVVIKNNNVGVVVGNTTTNPVPTKAVTA